MATAGDDLIHSAWDPEAEVSVLPLWKRPLFWAVALVLAILLPALAIGLIFFSDAIAVWGTALLGELT